MARRRLMTILATTCVAGMVSAPALANPLELVADPVEEAVTEVVDTATTSDVVETVSEPVEDVVDTDLEVDVAPSDEDGSPQLEVDGGVTVGDERVDVGGATDPVEDAIDPDPAPSPSPSPSAGTSSEGERRAAPTAPDGPGGLLPGGGVVAAGDEARPAGTAATSEGSRRQGAGYDLGGIGLTRFGGGTADVERVPDPEVAPPLLEDTVAPDAPSVLAPETPAVLAGGTGAIAEDGGVATALLRALAAAMVLGTGAAWTRRATEEA